MMTTTTWKAILATALVSLAAACGNRSQSGTSVSARAMTAAGAPTAKGLVLASGITVQEIRMAVQRVSVEGGDAMGAGCAASPGMEPGSDDSDDGECELEFGPFDVDLAGSALSGAVSFAFEVPIPAGTFEEIAIEVNTVPAEKAGANPVLLALAEAHASILVDGIVDEGTASAKPFTFAAPLEVTQKREGKITLGDGSNVTLDFDPGLWFGPSTARLDPTVPANQDQILANIRASIRLLKDDDHDGRDDDDELAGGHP